MSDQTKTGIDVFDEDRDGRIDAPQGHDAGLNLLSELFIPTSERPTSDLAIARECIGDRSGLLRPSPMMLMSQRLRQALAANEVKGYGCEVVHRVDA